MMIAFQTWLQAPSNPENIPTEWPWITEEISNDKISDYLVLGYQVLSPEAFEAYKDAHDEAYNLWLSSKQAEIDRQLRLAGLQKRVEFGQDLLVRFKDKNISEGINWMQAIHLHSRIKDWVVTYPTGEQFPNPSYAPVAPAFQGRQKSIDLINMLTVSGDVETCCFALMFGANDDFTLPEHWVSESRRQWLITEIKAWLGWP